MTALIAEPRKLVQDDLLNRAGRVDSVRHDPMERTKSEEILSAQPLGQLTTPIWQRGDSAKVPSTAALTVGLPPRAVRS